MDKANNSVFEKKVEEFVSLLKSGGAIADAAGITDEQLESLYALAYQNYSVKSYNDAKNIFRALCLYDHSQQRFYMGLAASQQGLGEFAEAAQSYSFACLISGLKDPKPMYYAAICLLKSGKKNDAITALESIEIMGREGNAEDRKFKQQALSLKNILKEQK
ncbi:MAG: SycD/LcrH family type III secretion system chaperone [Succinivibrio sp.]